MTTPVTFTVAIPTHDRRDTVVLAAQSAIRQTRPPEEVLVLCDGCTDGTAEAIAALGDPRIRAVELPKGPGYAYGHRDHAVRDGTGDVVTWLADDDLFLPDHLERIGAIWDAGGADLVLAPAVIVHEDDRLEWIGRDWRVAGHRRTVLTETNTSVMASVSVRRGLVAEVGGWDAELQRAADWDLWKRVLEHGARPGWHDEPTVLHFRATGRRQAWSLRVAQNRRWAARLDDPAELAEIRAAAHRARSEWEGALTDELREVRAIAQRAADEAARASEAASAQHARAEQAEAQVAQAQARAEAAEALVAELRASQAADRARLADAERDRAILQAIYRGGWWRMRGRLYRAIGRTP